MVDSTKTNPFHINTTEKTMISGGFAGSVGKTITAPLSRLTILYQVGPVLACASGTSKLNINSGDSLWTTSKNIFKHEGALAFWKGNFTSVLHRFPYSAVNFYSYEVSRAFLCDTFNTKETPLIRFVCGGFSGMSACFACYPLELIRTRMTVMNSFNSKTLTDSIAAEAANAPKSRFYQSKIYKVFRDILAQDGPLGLYRGLSVSLFVAVPTLAIGFSVYGQMKQTLVKYGGIFRNKHNNHLSVPGALLSGIVSGITSSMIMFPADVVRKRMQVSTEKLTNSLTTMRKSSVQVTNTNNLTTMPDAQVNGNVKIQFSNTTTINASLGGGSSTGTRSVIFNHYKTIFKTDGIRGMYRGILPELLKVCPMVAITFCTYEMTSDFLNEKFPTPSILQTDVSL